MKNKNAENETQSRFGELDFCIPKNKNAEKRGAQVGVLRVIFYLVNIVRNYSTVVGR